MHRLFIDIQFKEKQGNMLIEMTDHDEWQQVTMDLHDAMEGTYIIRFNFGEESTVTVDGGQILSVRSYRGK